MQFIIYKVFDNQYMYIFSSIQGAAKGLGD